MRDIEWPVKPCVQRFRVDEAADLGRLAGEQPSDPWVEPTHECPFDRGAARCAVADMADLVGENLVVELLDPRGHLWFVAEHFDADAAQFVKHYATRHLGCAHERESDSLRKEHSGLNELAHDQERPDDVERQIENVEYVG